MSAEPRGTLGRWRFALSERQLQSTDQHVLIVQWSHAARRHSEAGVLVIRCQFDVLVQQPVQPDSHFLGLLRRSCRFGESRKGITVDAQLAIAQREFDRTQMTESASRLKRIPWTDASIAV